MAPELCLRQQLLELQQQYRQRRWRLPLWLQVETTSTVQQTSAALLQLLGHRTTGAGFWLGEWLADTPPPPCTTQIKHKGQLLGVEADWILINGLAGIDWDLLAASSGCLRAGGLWLLISIVPEQFALQANPQAQRLLSFPQQAMAQPSNFQQFWLAQQHSWWQCRLDPQSQQLNLSAPSSAKTQAIVENFASIQTGQMQEVADPLPPEGAVVSPHIDVNQPMVTPEYSTTLEQQQAMTAILKVVTGHRRRPLLLTAHRGRGKSATLGLAAAQLQLQGKTKLIITAPQPAAAAVALQHARAELARLNPDATLALQFWPVDLLLQQQPAADLVLVDEAAAIPLPLLQQLTEHYSRLVFATTEHGYEGTGRSFSLKFQPYLQQHCPGWRQLQLHQPIRYAIDDPLERQIFDSFLLACQSQTPTYDAQLPLHIQVHQAAGLLRQPTLLADIFGLLSLAHYHTEVSDLWALLDNPHLQLIALYQSEQLLGCAVLSREGEFPEPLAQQIYQGQRRVQGHLLAQSLAFHLAAPALAVLPLARVQRIVIHPAWQRCGLGRSLLAKVQQYCQQQGFAAIGSSFGATPALWRFWSQQGFRPVKLSAQAELTSGEPSMLVLQSCDQRHQTAISQLQQQFSTALYWQLADSQRRLNPQLALQLCQPPPLRVAVQGTAAAANATALTDLAVEQLTLFARGQRPYELVELHLLDWFHLQRLNLPAHITPLLVQKLWQKQSWAELSKQAAGIGKAQLITQIRQAVSDFLQLAS